MFSSPVSRFLRPCGKEGGMIKLCRTAEEPKVPSRGNWTLIKGTYADLTSINDD
jgi:hypothetical protein